MKTVCIDGKKLNLNTDQATNVSWSQWCYMESNENHQKKIHSTTHNTCTGELTECIRNDWNKVLTHVNIKACVHYFYQIFIFSPNDSPLNTMKNVFHFI